MKFAVSVLPAVFAASIQAGPLADVPNEVSGTVSVIDTATDKVVHLKVSEKPRGIAMSPDGERPWGVVIR